LSLSFSTQLRESDMSLKTGTKLFHRTDVKLTLWYILTLFLSFFIIFGFLHFRLKHQLLKEVDRNLSDEANKLSSFLLQGPQGMDALRNFEIANATRTHYPIYFRILNNDGSLLYVSRNFHEIGYKLTDTMLPGVLQGKRSVEEIKPPGRKRTFRILSIRMPRKSTLNYIVQVSTHTRFVRKSLSQFKWNLLAAFPIVLGLGSLGGWFLARRSLSPIAYIAAKTRTITSSNLGDRLSPRRTDDEMDHLIATINAMIERLEGSFRRMAEFTADASHELKTPLSALRGEAELLLSKRRTSEEYEEGLAHMVDRFDHLNRLLNDLTLLSATDSAQVKVETSPLRLDLLVLEIGSLFQVLAEQKGILFEVGPLQQVIVPGDNTRLQQLFSNLIENAIKYTSKGSVYVTLEKMNGTAVVRIRDTGVGIPEQEQAKIFQRFYRVDKSRSRETGGTGLGLSIAEWIAHAHNGRIEVTSEPDKGSTFSVYLPLHKASVDSHIS
jgi:heavy metal sensor kinase